MKKYEITFSPKAKRALKSVSPKLKERLLEALFELSRDIYLGKALLGKYKGYYSLRVGTFRIIYYPIKKKLVVVVIRIADRKDIYKK